MQLDFLIQKIPQKKKREKHSPSSVSFEQWGQVLKRL